MALEQVRPNLAGSKLGTINTCGCADLLSYYLCCTPGTVTAFLWGAGAHVVYLAAVPEALRVTVAQRNVRLWQVGGRYMIPLLSLVATGESRYMSTAKNKDS